MARLQNKGKILTPQELKELSTKIKALADMAKMEDQLKALENQKCPRSHESSETLTPGAPLPPRSLYLLPDSGMLPDRDRQFRF